jgi:hypothetical protein
MGQVYSLWIFPAFSFAGVHIRSTASGQQVEEGRGVNDTSQNLGLSCISSIASRILFLSGGLNAGDHAS